MPGSTIDFDLDTVNGPDQPRTGQVAVNNSREPVALLKAPGRDRHTNFDLSIVDKLIFRCRKIEFVSG
jgi:hypothetical protein